MFEVFNGKGGRWATDDQGEAAFFASLPGFTVVFWTEARPPASR
jgi:hypothetical protein